MRFSVVILCFATNLVHIAFAQERGIFAGLLSKKPDVVIFPPIEAEFNNDDGCARQYPLTPKNSQQVPYAFKRYDIVPDLLDEAPAELLEVCMASQ